MGLDNQFLSHNDLKFLVKRGKPYNKSQNPVTLLGPKMKCTFISCFGPVNQLNVSSSVFGSHRIWPEWGFKRPRVFRMCDPLFNQLALPSSNFIDTETQECLIKIDWYCSLARLWYWNRTKYLFWRLHGTRRSPRHGVLRAQVMEEGVYFSAPTLIT